MTATWREGDLLWAPDGARSERSRLTDYAYWLRRSWGLSFTEYEALWQWSVEDPGEFWQSIWDYFGVRAHDAPGEMTAAQWFPGATLNYAEHALHHLDPGIAIPVPALELAWCTHQTAHCMAGSQQSRHQTAADVTGGARYQDPLVRAGQCPPLVPTSVAARAPPSPCGPLADGAFSKRVWATHHSWPSR